MLCELQGEADGVKLEWMSSCVCVCICSEKKGGEEIRNKREILVMVGGNRAD